jgi:two-component system, cell cycle sensor histidine kinase and response regulator CckA
VSVTVRVLIVEDSEDDTALLVRELSRGGHELTFERVDTPAGMSVALDNQEWDLVVCDYSMPRFSGTEALALLRTKDLEVPFIFLSGTMGEETAVASMKQGAQDYIMKDNRKRLLPAIQRELREADQRRERKRLEQQVQELRKFEAIGRLAGGIAHDFNNALGVILGWAQMGYDNVPADSPVRENFQMIRDQAQRSAGLTRQLLAFARRQVLQPRNIKLNDLVLGTMALLKAAIGERVELNFTLAPDLQVTTADPTQIEQVLMNLCLNARDAMPQGGRIVIETQNVEIREDSYRTRSYGQPGRHVLLSVSDTGVGMDAATLDRIFEPFFTTKEMGKGTGLGLATVYGIVRQHGGFVNARSEPGHGTTFRVYLPASTGRPEAVELAASEEARKGGGETILVAEDHDALRGMVRESLTSQDYTVILASDGQDAVRLFKANVEEIQLVVLDVVMPSCGGPEAYSQMCAIRPDLPVIFMTGHTAESASLNSMIENGALFLQKPYSPEILGQTIRRALNRKSA